MSIADNIRRIRSDSGLSQEEFGKIAGVSSMAVSQWENGRAVPRMGAVQRIADHFHISKGEVIDERDERHSIPANAILPRPSAAYATLLGRVHAGDAQEPDVLDERVPVPEDVISRHPSAYFLQVEGQCMSRVYPEGCYILIDPDKDPQNGSIAVVSIDGSDYVMRRMYRGATTLVLSPESWDEGFEDIVIAQGDDRTVEFHGTVVWFQAAEEMD